MPKSSTRTRSRSSALTRIKKMLAGFKSRWMTPDWCAARNAVATSHRIDSARPSSIGPCCLMTSLSGAPVSSSMTMKPSPAAVVP